MVDVSRDGGTRAVESVAEAEWRPGEVRFSARAFDSAADASRRTFVLGDRIHWRAAFGEPARTVRIDVVTVARGEDGSERAVSGHELWLAHPQATSNSGWLDPAAYRGPGSFLLRFVRGSSVIAEGSFEVVDQLGSRIVH